ncbi:MAG: type II secretion system protein [Opitutales bacterium]|nr:type II secretion system protein [Opitutales bacterium]
MASRQKAFSLVELIVVVSVIAVLAAVIIPMLFDMSGTGRITTETRNVQLWNQTYTDAYATGAPELTTANDWATASSRLAAGVTANLANGTVTFACQEPEFINVGDPTFVPGRGITAVP